MLNFDYWIRKIARYWASCCSWLNDIVYLLHKLPHDLQDIFCSKEFFFKNIIDKQKNCSHKSCYDSLTFSCRTGLTRAVSNYRRSKTTSIWISWVQRLECFVKRSGLVFKLRLFTISFPCRWIFCHHFINRCNWKPYNHTFNLITIYYIGYE